MEEVVGYLFNLEVQSDAPQVGLVGDGSVPMVLSGPDEQGNAAVADDADDADVAELVAAAASRSTARTKRPTLRAKGLEVAERDLSYSAPDEQGSAAKKNGSATAKKDAFANVGRNQPCPCGSGKKFKACHGSNQR